MNPGNVVNQVASKAGSAAASGVASNAASSVGNAALNGAGSAATNAVSNTASSAVSNVASDVAKQPVGQNINVPDSPQSSTLDKIQEVADQLPQAEENGEIPTDQNNPEGLKPGDKVEPGKVVNEDGKVEDSATKKTLKAVGRGAAAYFTGGESLKVDQAVTNNQISDKLIGVVSDAAEANIATKIASEQLDDLGVPDMANDLMDAAGNAMNGDIAGTVDKAKDVVKDSDKMVKGVVKKTAKIIAMILAPFALLMIIVLTICSPVIGGFLDVTEAIEDVGDFFTGGDDDEPDFSGGGNIVLPPGDYENLSDTRKAIIAAASSVLGSRYNWGGHPKGPGLSGFPPTGLDCAGYVQWCLWTALGENPGYLTTAAISDLIGTKFTVIDASELQPGDIALKFKGVQSGKQNHTGIYAGNGLWLHAKGKNYGIVCGPYSNFTIFLRYNGVA